jgi:hypothetical protein
MGSGAKKSELPMIDPWKTPGKAAPKKPTYPTGL